MVETVIKPWGTETKWAHTAHYVGKILDVKANQKLSVQYHNEKVETLYVMSGTGHMYFYSMDEDGDPRVTSLVALEQGVKVHIPPKQIHCLQADTDMMVLEVSTNHLNDLVRIKDIYDRK
jgi:mannose-6-phosphate isomerase-like protein (cupin superfamily)